MPEIQTLLEDLLSRELREFSKIFRLEQEKSSAIISKDGNMLQKLCAEQEQYLSNISSIETTRKNLSNDYFKNEYRDNLVLKEIASHEGTHRKSLLKTGEKLKKILDKIKLLQETNSKMINDNLEFFSKMISELKYSVSTDSGYCSSGARSGMTTGSLLLDKKI